MSSTNRSDARSKHIADYYVTPIKHIKIFLEEFLKNEQIDKNCLILDPCSGGDESHSMSYVQALNELEFNNIRTIDIRSDSLAELKEDYLTTEITEKPKVIITNPPFNQAMPIIEKALKDVQDYGYVVMLLRLNFMGGVTKKKEFWKRVGLPKYIFVHRKRMSFTDKGGTDSIEYAHYVWKKINPLEIEFSKTKIIG